jgi:thiol-disulfide isomerase/thioredoxin
MNRTAIITVGILTAILAVAALGVYLVQQRGETRELEQSPAALALQNSSSTSNFTDFKGNQADLDQYLGQTMIVNSWASWAPSSADELKLLTEVAQQYQDQGVVVIGINRAESRVQAERYLQTLGLSDSVQLIVDKDDRYYRAIEGYTMPETVIYDTKGNVLLHKRGAITKAELKLVFDQSLQSAE